MQLEGMSGAEFFFAEVAGDDDSLKVVCLNMILNIHAVAFFSTQGTSIGLLLSISGLVVALFHQ